MNVNSSLQAYQAHSAYGLSYNRQNLAAASADAAGSGRRSEEDKVSLSAAGLAKSAAADDGTKVRMVDYFVGPSAKQPPAGAGPVEQMAYRRDGISIDITSKPAHYKDNGEEVTWENWLAREQEIDKRVDGRIEVYNQAKADGLSDDEIVKRIKAYDQSLPAGASHQDFVDKNPLPLPSMAQILALGSVEQQRRTLFASLFA